MTPFQIALLYDMADCMFYRPRGNEKECAELVALGYIRHIKQGELNGFCVTSLGTSYLRKRSGYEM